MLTRKLGKVTHEELRDRISIPQEDPHYRYDQTTNNLAALDEAHAALDKAKLGTPVSMSAPAWVEAADWLTQVAEHVEENAEWSRNGEDNHRTQKDLDATIRANLSYAARLYKLAEEIVEQATQGVE